MSTSPVLASWAMAGIKRSVIEGIMVIYPIRALLLVE
jgi:hypothetical protein